MIDAARCMQFPSPLLAGAPTRARWCSAAPCPGSWTSRKRCSPTMADTVLTSQYASCQPTSRVRARGVSPADPPSVAHVPVRLAVSGRRVRDIGCRLRVAGVPVQAVQKRSPTSCSASNWPKTAAARTAAVHGGASRRGQRQLGVSQREFGRGRPPTAIAATRTPAHRAFVTNIQRANADLA